MKDTQPNRVLKHMRLYGKISSWDAFQEYGITRLSAIIYKLKKEGFTIESENKVGKTRLGNTCNYSEYKIVN
jgi:hypothetical protein